MHEAWLFAWVRRDAAGGDVIGGATSVEAQGDLHIQDETDRAVVRAHHVVVDTGVDDLVA